MVPGEPLLIGKPVPQISTNADLHIKPASAYGPSISRAQVVSEGTVCHLCVKTKESRKKIDNQKFWKNSQEKAGSGQMEEAGGGSGRRKRAGGGDHGEQERLKPNTRLFSPDQANISPIKTGHFKTLLSSYLKDFEVTEGYRCPRLV